MSDFFNDVKKIVEDECNNVNDKLIGLSFLESLKFNLIPNLSVFTESTTADFISANDKSFLIQKHDKNKLDINFKFSENSVPQLKKEIKINTLFIVVAGGLKIDIYNNNSYENSNNINIYSSMGICLSLNTFVNLTPFKNCFYIEILITDENNNIENSKKDII